LTAINREGNPVEYRNKIRKPVNFSFQYTLKDDPSGYQIKDGKVVDHSEKGIRFEAMEKLPIGTRLRLIFKNPDPTIQDFRLKPEGVVVWSIQPDPKEPVFRVGLKYL